MRRVIVGTVVVVAALAMFYVAWPAWSAWRVRAAIEANDAGALERTIDFPRVRERAKPILVAEVERSLEKLKRESGGLGSAIAGTLKDRFGGKLAETAIDTLVTPSNVITMFREGKDLRRILNSRSIGVPGGPQPQTETPNPPAKEPRHLRLANVKSYRITGPLSISIGVAHDPAASVSDMTVELAFTGGDWKVVGLVPRL